MHRGDRAFSAGIEARGFTAEERPILIAVYRKAAKWKGRQAGGGLSRQGGYYHSVQRSPLQYPRPSYSRNVMPGPACPVSS